MKSEPLESRLLKRIDRKRGDVFLRADSAISAAMTRSAARCASSSATAGS
jgi:hypothetical protein